MNQPQVDKQVSDLVLGILSERQRHRQRTDLKNLYRQSKKSDPNIDEDKFMDVFRSLAAAGAGSLIVGRRGNPNRFIWKYNLKDIAEAAQTSGVKPSTFQSLADKPKEEVKAVAEPRKIKRSKRVIKAVQMKPKAEVMVKTRKPRKQALAAKPGTFLQIDLSTMSPEDVKALVDLVSKK